MARTLDEGLVRELDAPPPSAKGDDPRRRYYAITPLGRRVARAELEHLEGAAKAGRARGLL